MKTTIGLPTYTITHATLKYAKANWYTSLLRTNENNLYQYLTSGNWVVPNEHPLVQYLILLGIDEEQDDSWLYQKIKQQQNSNASTLNLSSLYSRGQNFLRVFFPEMNHHTWLCVPFGESEEEGYVLTQAAYPLRPLTTLYTTDTRFHYDTHAVTRQRPPLPEPVFTIVQVNPAVLGIGYARYLRDRINQGITVGLTPHAYIGSQVMASFYLQHNLMTMVNMSRQVDTTVIMDKPDWTYMDITHPTQEYLRFLQTTLKQKPLSAYEHYLDQLCTLPTYGDVLKESLLPHKGHSASFMILRWIYQFSELVLTEGYLTNLKATKQTDVLTVSRIKKALSTKNMLLQRVPDMRWQDHIRARFDHLSQIVETL